MTRFVSEIGTGPIGNANGPRTQVTAVTTPIIAICETRKDDVFDFAAMSLIFVFLFP